MFCIADGIANECYQNLEDIPVRRKKRSNSKILIIPNDDDMAYEYDPPQINITNLPEFPTKSGLTEQQANNLCTKAIKTSPFGKVCLDMYPDMNYTTYVEECVTDAKVNL